MKKKWQIMLALFLALVTVVTVAVPALAQNDETEATSIKRGALAIIAPWTVPAGTDFTVRAFLRENQEPFPGAGVWAIDADSVDTVKEQIGQLRDDADQNLDYTDYESTLDTYCTYLGRTGDDGRLACNFEQAGRYVLIAARNGYMPGFTRIGIREMVNALGIRAPKRARVDEPVTIGVFERGTQDPLEGAGVWAVSRDNVEALQQDAQALKEDSSLADEEKDYEAIVSVYGEFLGLTGPDGTLEHIFSEAKGYLLVAVMDGYFPAFAPLAVVDTPDVLAIRAPHSTQVDREITIGVFNRLTSDPVADAGVWAVSRDDMEALQQDITALREDSATSASEKDYEGIVSLYGTFLGTTGTDGTLNASFDTPGVRILVAVKDGCIPGFALLVVREAPEAETTTSANRLAPNVTSTEALTVR